MDLVARVFGLAFLIAVLPIAAAQPCSIDRWESFISDAAIRFSITSVCLRAVMQAESAGCEFMNGQPTISSAGAMGLMQLMPATWEQQRQRLALGDNPYDPHDNILAAAAYLRELLDRYGMSGFIAAYHAGPDRYDAFLTEGRALPQATLEYVSRVQRFCNARNNRMATRPLAQLSSNRSLFVTLRHTSNDNPTTDESTSDVQSDEKAP